MKAFWKLVNPLKISCKYVLDCFLIILKWPPIYRGQKLLQRFVGIKSQKKICQKIELLESVRKSDSIRSTGTVDRQRSKIRPLGICGRSPGRPKLPESTAQCSVDRDGRLIHMHRNVRIGRPGRSTGFCQFWKIRTSRNQKPGFLELVWF